MIPVLPKAPDIHLRESVRDPIARDALLHTRDASRGQQARTDGRAVSLWIKVLVDRVKRRAACEQPVDLAVYNYWVLTSICRLICGLSNARQCVKTCLEYRLRVVGTGWVVVYKGAAQGAESVSKLTRKEGVAGAISLLLPPPGQR